MPLRWPKKQALSANVKAEMSCQIRDASLKMCVGLLRQ